MRRRQFLRIVSAAASAGLLARVGTAKARSFAGKQIRVIVPFGARYRQGRRRDRMDAARDAIARECAAGALVLNSVNPILAQGAALGDVSMLAGFDEDITAAIPSGAEAEVNPEMGVLTVVD